MQPPLDMKCDAGSSVSEQVALTLKAVPSNTAWVILLAAGSALWTHSSLEPVVCAASSAEFDSCMFGATARVKMRVASNFA
eukprot:2773642-Amphidinium_carterae.1